LYSEIRFRVFFGFRLASQSAGRVKAATEQVAAYNNNNNKN
jgi:hypothetical protein